MHCKCLVSKKLTCLNLTRNHLWVQFLSETNIIALTPENLKFSCIDKTTSQEAAALVHL